MPVKNLDDFKSQYYSIISKIAQQAKLRDFDIEGGGLFCWRRRLWKRER